ncbi:unnamed protein product [Prorocentrum cordatum]|uniref:Major facilitator superfamily (MFS) profile domain-containing protein n=1 Tax=Prorocentrum cordatum TaxID=2364126 RepID=A0ABN9QAV2_9DINO|nr:unnamed protein product [Polarella glacialis]
MLVAIHNQIGSKAQQGLVHLVHVSSMSAAPLQDDASTVGMVEVQEDDFAQTADRSRRVWKINARLVYAVNFVHMTMYTMCLGGIFDIFLYNLSQDQITLISDPVVVGARSPPVAPVHVDTQGSFELTFGIKPARDLSYYPVGSPCKQSYTCGTSILHITDGSGNGDCCKVGNRMPMIMFGNDSTRLMVAMDAVGQDETMTVREYDKLQKCSAQSELPVDVWSNVKIKACAAQDAKGKLSPNSTVSNGALVLFVNGTKVCEVPGTAYHQLPERLAAQVFLGPLQPPLQETHIAANISIRDVKYGRPASNLFVGTVNSVQGVMSVLIMYPIGWLGDKMNRYSLTRLTVFVGAAAAALLMNAVVQRDTVWLYAGVIVFTLYQQSISSTIYAILADNVPRQRRTQAGVNYKTFSALAMSSGPAIQLLALLSGYASDTWSTATFQMILLPGWALLPVVCLLAFALKPVGKTISGTPSVDELLLPMEGAESASPRQRLSEAWLDERVVCSVRRRFVVATSVNLFFILTLLANGMTVRYFSLYFTQVLKFTPVSSCLRQRSPPCQRSSTGAGLERPLLARGLFLLLSPPSSSSLSDAYCQVDRDSGEQLRCACVFVFFGGGEPARW